MYLLHLKSNSLKAERCFLQKLKARLNTKQILLTTCFFFTVQNNVLRDQCHFRNSKRWIIPYNVIWGLERLDN